MPTLGFGEYRPDVSNINQAHTEAVLNVLPRGDGYGPFHGHSVFTSVIAGQARGLFFARNSDGSITVFAGTSERLYQLDNTTLTWTDVSKGGSAYTALSSTTIWTFAQFNLVVIACQANTVPQAFTLNSSSAFADLSGSPPQAAYVAVVNRFVVLSGLQSFPRRVQWSGLNAITTWTSGVTYSDSQDLPDGGNTRGVVGGEFGVIFQDSGIRRMVFSPGADIIFQIDRLARDVGTAFPYSIVDADGVVFAHTTKGFMMIDGSGAMKPIGKERVDRTFADAVDDTMPHLCIGAPMPGSNVILWAYRTEEYIGTGFNKVLAYDSVLDRWSPIELEGWALASLAKPGLTLENLDTINSVSVSGAADNGSGLVRLTVASTSGWATGDIKTIASVGGTTEANGTWTITIVNGTTMDLQGSTYANAYTSGGYVAGSVDDLTVSFDDISSATLGQLGMIDDAGALGYFTGDALEATVETSEQSGVTRRTFVAGVYPLTDAATVYGSIGRRENLQAPPTYSDETLMNAEGRCPARVSTRFARAKLRIPAGETWTFVSGVNPQFQDAGGR